jgi:hypothetical protein
LPPKAAERLIVEMARRAGGDKSAAATELPKIEGNMLELGQKAPSKTDLTNVIFTLH